MTETRSTLPAKHEAFCKGIVEGMTASEAYLWAGYQSSPRAAAVSANRLLNSDAIKARIADLLQQKADIEKRAIEIAAEKLAITKEKVLAEYAKIAFSDLRKAVTWHGSLTEVTDNPEGGDVAVVKHTYSNHVQLVGSGELDDDMAAAIAEVSQNASGGLKIKMHDKKGALDSIARHLGMFKEVHEHTGKNGGPISTDNRHHHTVDPVSIFDGFLAEAIGDGSEDDSEATVPN